MRRAALLAVLATLAACRGGEPATAVALDGHDGDAWAFARRMTGRADGCDAVEIASPRATVRATVEDDRFAAVVPLAAGDNRVVATCADDGTRSAPRLVHVRLADRPVARARARYAEGGLELDARGSAPSPVRAVDLVAWRWTARDGNPAAIPGLPADGEAVAIAPPAVDGDYLVDLEVTDADGVIDRAAVRFRVDGDAWVPDPLRTHPAWVDDAVVYGVAPFFFGDRRLPDVTARLDELDALGVSVLWLSPVMQPAGGDYGYATVDHFALRPDFGTPADLRALIDGAHARGMRVILDVVANHTSIEHPYVAAAPDYYRRDADGELTHYFDWEELPNLEHDHPEVVTWLAEAMAFWVREYDVDGFRADAAWGPAERTPTFWAEVRAELARIEPDLLLLAEGSARDAGFFHGGFDAAYDWTWELGEWAWRDAFDQVDAAPLEAALTADGDGFDADAVVFRFLDNNDTRERFATRYGAARVPASAAILLTTPGLPSLWTGSETGAALEPYDEGPVLDWSDPDALGPVYRRLIALRRALPALTGKGLALVDAEPASVLAYVRPGATPAESALVVANLAGAPVTASLARTPELDALLGGGAALTDAYHDGAVAIGSAGERATVVLPADGFRVLVRGAAARRLDALPPLPSAGARDGARPRR